MGQIMELFLKAFLSKKGIGENRMQKELGHKIIKL